MNRTSGLAMPFSLALLSSSALALGQGVSSAPVAIQPAMQDQGTCPASMYAQRQGIGSTVQVGGSPSERSQRLRLALSNLQRREIVSVTITVRGYDAAPRVMPVDGARGGMLARTIDFKLNVRALQRAERDLTVRSIANVKWIDLESVAYSDGTSWNASEKDVCRVSPNGYMLVAER